MQNLHNFPQFEEYLKKRHISADFVFDLISRELIKPQKKGFLIAMRNIEGDIVGWQERYFEPIIFQGKELKSKSIAGSQAGSFFTEIDFTHKIYIFEGEADFLVMGKQSNMIGIQGVAQLKKLVEQLLQKGVQEIYICVDNDPAGDSSINALLSLDKDQLSCICDARSLFAGYNDVGEYVVTKSKIPTVEEIQKHGKNLAEYKTSIEAFLHEGKNGVISLDHFELAKWIISKYEIATVKGNIFMFKEGIRKLTDKYVLEQIILQEIELYTKPYNKKIQSVDKNTTYDFILSLGLDENLEKQLMKTGDYNIPLNDGVYNAKTKELVPYRKDMYFFQKFDYEYNDLQGTDDPVLFLQTLDSILEGYSEDVKNFMQEFIGSMFISFTRGKALMLTGSGGNGKGVLADTISYVLGNERVLHAGLQEISSNPQMVYNLIDKYALIDTDMSQSHQLDNSLNKKLISAEPISGKQLYHNPITFRGKVKVWCNCNEMPYLKSIDNSVLRRWFILELKNIFIGKEDFLLVEKLKKEKIPIRRRGMKGLDRLIKRGFFLPPQEIKDQLDTFIHENDTVALFLDEGPIEIVENAEIYNKDLYLAYKFFCMDGGYKALSQKKFSKRLKNKGFKPFRNRIGRGFIGLREDKPF